MRNVQRSLRRADRQQLPEAAQEALAKLRGTHAANAQMMASLDRIEAVLEGREPYEIYDGDELAEDLLEPDLDVPAGVKEKAT